jgi:hypothetical protein
MPAPRRSRRCAPAAAAVLLILAAAACFPAACGRSHPQTSAPAERLVGAYYYTWFPRNFVQGTLRSRLVPPQEPALGQYDSGDPRAVERQIAWAAEGGIDFLAVGWWPRRGGQNEAFTEGFLKARNLSSVKFCLFYETWELGFDRLSGMTYFDEKKTRRFVEDMELFGRRFFGHPSYLKVGGRPVVILYLARTFAGNYALALGAARERLRQQGWDVYFIGDEVFWNATPDTASTAGGAALTAEPQLGRIRLFDAITSYNMYESAMEGHRGYGSQSAFIADVARRYRTFARAAPEVAFVPGIIPGYNDRGVRLKAGHFAIPRRWAPEAGETSFLEEMWRRVAVPLADPRLNMVLITSWNEWNEDTAIEPLAAAPPTSRDESPSGDLYTEGYPYAGHGTDYLAALRELRRQGLPRQAGSGAVRPPGRD